jgi:chemotaxis protein MotB
MNENKLTDIEEIAQTDGRSAWLMSYADLITLILVFFILLLTLSKMKLEKITDTLKSIKVTAGSETQMTSLYEMIDSGRLKEGKMIDQLTGMREVNIYKEFNSLVRRKNLEKDVKATFVEGKLVLRVGGNVLFGTGSAELLPGANRLLSGIFQILNENPQYDIDIQGHTDDRPINTPKFASNWELSAIRATTVLRYLIEKGISEERLTATGFAGLRPVAGNDTPEERRKNRRVEFVLTEKE